MDVPSVIRERTSEIQVSPGEGQRYRERQALMVSLVLRVVAVSESSVSAFGCLDNVGVMAKSGSLIRSEHHGIDSKWAWSGSTIVAKVR